MFMTWFRGEFHGAEFEIKSNGFRARENNLWRKLARLFSTLLRYSSALSPVSPTDLQSYGGRKRKSGSRWRLARSRLQRDGGGWIPGDVTLARLRSPLIRGVENLGAGRIEHSRAAGGAYRPLHETRRGKEDVVRARAREHKHAPARTYYARTHARMPVHTHQGKTEEGHECRHRRKEKGEGMEPRVRIRN